LTPDDLARIKPSEGRVIPRTKGFRDSHHRIARLVAAGLRNEEVLRITGYSYGRLSSLKQDPAFQELVSGYRKRVDEAFVEAQDEFYETSVSNMLRAERQIEEHLDRADEADELIPLKTLMSLTADRADRFGYGKRTTQTNVNIDFAAKLEAINKRRGNSTVIDAKASLLPSSPDLAPREQGPSSQVDPAPNQSIAVPAGFRRRM
jgi:hypothetical protein